MALGEAAVTVREIKDALPQIISAVKELQDHASAPVEIMRGKDGRVTGMKRGNVVRMVKRGDDGLVASA